ncbi:MAG: hypothetical protein FJ279_07790 [Planctomycetes bacterium]|nr:hypothetical protein [Planctomycetota bacterium]
MVQTYEALIDQAGNIRLLEPVSLPALHRALVTVLDDEAEPTALETALMSQQALAVEWDTPDEDEAWSHLARVPSL